MSIDLSQFHQVFFEESVEGLDIMESALMDLDPADVDSETINAIFRCAHSIKGGSATFGFNAIGEFTHVLETLLDQVRSEQRALVLEHVNLLLESVDSLREMLALAQSGDLEKPEDAAKLQIKFEKILEQEGAVSPDDNAEGTAPEAETPSASSLSLWEVEFSPHSEIMQTGNDPVRILRELVTLGANSVKVDTSRLPSWEGFDPEVCYLGWSANAASSIEEGDIREVFEWVTDLADISVKKVVSPDSPVTGQWKIRFVPTLDGLQTGNDPVAMLKELRSLSNQYECKADTSSLPDFFSLEPDACYLGWDIKLQSDADKTQLDGVFEWVVDDCQIEMSELKPEMNSELQQERKSEHELGNSAAVEGKSVTSFSEESAHPSATAVVAKDEKSKAASKGASKASKVSTDATFIRVGIDKIDNLINMVGELVITQSMLGQLSDDVDIARVPRLIEGLSQLEQNTRELQEGVMRIRMLPISFSFNRFPRLVRDLSARLEKQVDLVIHGEQTELDKTVMEKIGDPLVHLVRNAVDHGIELPAVRKAAGKSETGTITLNAFHKGGHIVIEIVDDGAGLNRAKVLDKAIDKKLVNASDAELMTDEQVYDLIFQPGFSTAAAVTDVSGRGVGMDVVKRNIQALNGAVDIKSKLGEGSTITIRLPLTLAILDGQLIRVGSNIYIFPLVSIVESMQCRGEFVNQLAGGQKVFRLREEYVPIIELSKTFAISSDTESIEGALMVVVEFDGQKVGVIVDELLGQQQVVIKSLEHNYKQVEGVSGATILGDGTVALILDVQSIVDLFSHKISLAGLAGKNVTHTAAEPNLLGGGLH